MLLLNGIMLDYLSRLFYTSDISTDVQTNRTLDDLQLNSNDDNIASLLNMNSEQKTIKININEDQYLYSSIIHYAIKFSKNNNLYDYETTFKPKEKTYIINKKICIGKNVITYNNIDIIINIYQSTIPLATSDTTKYHYNMIASIDYKDDEDKFIKQQLFDKFCDESLTYYKNTIKNCSKEPNKTTIYIWDDYWETIDKRVSRNLNTIYLEGKEIELRDKIVDFYKDDTKELYESMGIPYKYNIMLHGYPGTGKTSLIFAIASDLGMNVALLQFNRTMTDSDFMRALRRTPENTIVVLEDTDVLFEARKKTDENAHNISFSGIINALDGIGHVDGQVIFMTTNRLMVLDQAFKRPGRIDCSMEFKYSNKNQIKAMFDKFMPNKKDQFKEFYSVVKNFKVTTAGLQQYLFGNRLNENIMTNIDEFKELCAKNDYENTKETLYT